MIKKEHKIKNQALAWLVLCSKARCTVTLESVDTDSSCSKQTNHADDGKNDCCCVVVNQGLTYVEHKIKSRGYSGDMCLYKKGRSPQATKTEQPRGARRSHQKAKTNGTRGKATREAQTPGQPEGASAKTERRGAKAKPKPTRKEAAKTTSTNKRAKNTQ